MEAEFSIATCKGLEGQTTSEVSLVPSTKFTYILSCPVTYLPETRKKKKLKKFTEAFSIKHVKQARVCLLGQLGRRWNNFNTRQERWIEYAKTSEKGGAEMPLQSPYKNGRSNQISILALLPGQCVGWE
uniref:Uncharacterized protein n=1 Tax=Strix occidentalis caurina TaxID=311401 RepID=A0A8D0FAP0_STROC